MKQILRDWKDEAETFKEKALLLAILSIILLIFAVPEINIKHYEKPIDEEFKLVEIDDLDPQKIDLPTFQKTNYVLVFEEEEYSDMDNVITIEPSIIASRWDLKKVPTPKVTDNIFQIYEEMPSFIKTFPKPKYTKFARKAAIEGSVVLQVLISKTGKVIDISVLKTLYSGPNGLDESALNAVKQWEFKPAKNNGIAVDCWIKLPIEFKLN